MFWPNWTVGVLTVLLSVQLSGGQERTGAEGVDGEVATDPNESMWQSEPFARGSDGYDTFRIPAMVVTTKGTVLAFCEGRRTGRGDAGDIDTVLRRSTDGGRSWQALQVLVDFGSDTVGNPCPVVDRPSGRIWLLLTRNHGQDHERAILDGTSREARRVYLTYSDDDGANWASATEISDTARRPYWRWYATGPGCAIQLTRGPHQGRLVIPANHSDHRDEALHPYRSHVLLSDDHGQSWRIGGVLPPMTNESAVVELSDGAVMDNMRSYHGKNRRAVAVSADGGESFAPLALDETLIEPVCQASILRYTFADDGGKSRILFANPASQQRQNMTVRISYDEGNSWPLSRQVYAGSSAYSSLTKLPDGSIGLLYERDNYERIQFVRLTLQWLTRGQDQL